jgi:biotin transport system substrate-specific component
MFKNEIAIKNTLNERSWVKDFVAIVGGSWLIALFAHVSIPLPFTPVPITFQPHICLFLGATLGSRRGALAVLAFLFQGAMGLPVFATGKAGWLRLLGPTGGYLVGYVLGAFLTGYIVEKVKNRTPRMAILAMTAGNLVIYALGVFHLSNFLGLKGALVYGVLPFLIGDLIKLVLAYNALSSFRLFNALSK